MRVKREPARLLPGVFRPTTGAAVFWPLLSVNVLLGLYFIERWLIRPRIAGLLGRDETRNFGVPDAYVLAYFALLCVVYAGRHTIIRVFKFFGPMLAMYFAGGWIAIFVSAGLDKSEFARAFWASGQIAFCFFILGPVLLDAVERVGFYRAFLSYAAWIGIAGVISVTDKLGLTSFGNLAYYRLENALLGVNGFYVVGLLVPLLLFILLRSIGRKQFMFSLFIASILVFSHIGLALAGVRTGLILTVLGWAVGIWICVQFGEIRKISITSYMIALILLTGLIGLLGGTDAGREMFSLDIFSRRAEVSQGLFADDDRFFVYNMAWSDLLNGGTWLLGKGINQWVVLYPGTEVVHNVFLMAWWESGLVGLLGWVLLYARPYALLSFNFAAHAEERIYRGMAWGASFCILGAAIGGLAYPIGYSRSDWIWFILATTPVLLTYTRRDSGDHHSSL